MSANNTDAETFWEHLLWGLIMMFPISVSVAFLAMVLGLLIGVMIT